MQAKCYKYT